MLKQVVSSYSCDSTTTYTHRENLTNDVAIWLRSKEYYRSADVFRLTKSTGWMASLHFPENVGRKMHQDRGPHCGWDDL